MNRKAIITLSASIFSLFYIIITLLLTPQEVSKDFHFLNEFGAISLLSMIYIAIAVIFSLFILIKEYKSKGNQITFWLICSIGFTFLFMDELFQFHEIAGYIIENYFSLHLPISINDLIVIIYGIIALLLLPILLPTLRTDRTLMLMFSLAFIFYFIHTLIDTAISSRTEFSTIIEESFKIYSMQFIMIGNFLRYRITTSK